MNSKENLEIKMENLKTLAEKMYGNSCYPIWIDNVFRIYDKNTADEITEISKKITKKLSKKIGVNYD